MIDGQYTNPYGLSLLMRRAMYRSGVIKARRVSVPVISVGNLTVGGTGKTPVTKLIVQFLRDRMHKRVAIVMRGYKRLTKGLLVVSDGVTNFADTAASGDEAQIYAQELADVIVICDEERSRGAAKAVQLGAEVIVLDDGYQHLALHRDLNILLIAADEPEGPLIPFGRFRELSSAGRDADILLITGATHDDFSLAEAALPSYQLKDDALVAKAKVGPRALLTLDGKEVPLECLRGKRVLAVSSIAKPGRFHSVLTALGAEVVPFVLPDHSPFDATISANAFAAAVEGGCDYIVQTTKDVVKSAALFRGSPVPTYVLDIEYMISDEARFFSRIESVLHT